MVGNYKILSSLGEGGMGAVFKAVDVMLEREVAIKMLRPEIASQPQIVERFRSEAVTLAKLNHPSIATLYSFFRQGDQFFMVMEYVAGQTLDGAIRQSGALPAAHAVAILSQALEGIGHAHAMGILHRDLKPTNIMLPNTGGVKVMDFGIARLLSAARMTRTGGLVGTLEYIAPERVRGQEADLRSDLYSMGIVLYEMLAGRTPFRSDTEFELMRAHLEQSPPTLASLGVVASPAVEAVLMRALAKNPEERFSNAAEFRAALLGESAATQEVLIKPTRLATAPAVKETRMAPAAPSVVPAAVAAPAAAAARRKPNWILYGGAAAAVVILGLTAAIWASRKPAVPPAPASSAPVPAAPAPAPPPSTGGPLASSTPTGGAEGLPGVSPLTPPQDLPRSRQAPPATASTAKSAADLVNTKVLAPAEPPPVPGGPPLSLANVLQLLNNQTPSSQVIRIVERRGVDFLMSPGASSSIQNAGGSRALVAAITRRYVGGAAPPPAATQTAAMQTPAPVVAQPPAPVPVVHAPPANVPAAPQHPLVSTLFQVRTLCIAPMADDLNLHITSEIQRQLGGRIQIVPTPDRADAVMTGTVTERGGVTGVPGRAIGVQADADASVLVTDRTKTRILWRDTAPSRSGIMGAVRGGGTRKMAERIVSDLKKALR